MSSASLVAQRATQGVAGLVLSSAFVNVTSLASSLVLARALAPEEYGTFAVGATVVGFGRILGDCGAGSSLIQAPGTGEPDARELGRALAIQTSVAVTASGLLALCAPLLRAAFHAPAAATWIVIVLACTLVIEAPAVVPKVRLRREQRFKRLQVLQLASVLTLYSTQIGGLLAGFGLVALVAAQVVGSVTSTVTLVLYGGGLVRPVLAGARALARRGLAYQGTLVVQALFSVGSLAVVGANLTTQELGLWTWSTVLATPLISLALEMHHVLFPSLARLHEHHKERHDEAVQVVARLQFLFVGLAVGLLCGLAAPTIRLVFAPKWLEASGAARVALIGVLPLILATLLAAALESRGRPDLRLRSMAVSSFLGVVAVYLLAHRFGTTGAAAGSYLIVPLLDALILLRWMRIDVRRACVNAFVVATGTFILAHFTARSLHNLVSLLTAAVTVGLLGMLLVLATDRQPIVKSWALLRGK